MEKFPQSFDGEIVNDEAEERFEGEVVVDEDEKDAKDQELQVFKNQLDLGLDFYCQISGEKKEEVDIHPEQKLFFSYLEIDNPHKLKKAVPVPVLTEYGLLVGDSLYGFKSAYREQVLRFEAEQIMQESDDTDDFYANLKSYRSDFREKYIEEAKKSFVEEAREPFLLEKKKIEDEINSRYLQRTINSVGAEIIKSRYPEVSSEDALSVYKTAEITQRITDINKDKIEHLSSEKENGKKSLLLEKQNKKKYLLSKEQKKEENPNPEKQDKKDDAKKPEQKPPEKVDKKLLDLERKIKEAEKKIKEAEEGIARAEGEIEKAEEEFLDLKIGYGIDGLDANEIIKTAAKQYEEEKHKFITNGFMTEEEYEEFKKSKQNLGYLSLPIHSGKELSSEEKGEIFKAYRMLRESIKVELGNKYREEHGTELDYPANKKPFFSQKQAKHDSAVRMKEAKEAGLFESFDYFGFSDEEIPLKVPSIEESRESLEEVFEKYYRDKDPFKNTDEIISKTKRYFELAEKYRRGEVRFGLTPDCARRYISKKKSEINKRMYEETEPKAYQLAEKSADTITKKLAVHISGTDDAEDIIFTPAGCFIRQKDGSFEMKPITPFDKQIAAILDQKEARAWENTWENTREEIVGDAEHIRQEDFVNFVNRQFREMTGAFSEAIEGDSFKQLQQLREELGFGMNGLFGYGSKMNHLPTSREIQILGEVMPGVMNFITEVNFNPIKAEGYRKVDLKSLLSNLKALICGGSGNSSVGGISDLVSIRDGRATLNFYPYQTVLYDTNYDHEKARSVLYSCLGYELLSIVGDKKIKEFADLLGEKANISSQSIFRTYGVRVINPLERRRIAIRTYFVSEFNKFAHGESEDEFKEYFNSLSGGEH